MTAIEEDVWERQDGEKAMTIQALAKKHGVTCDEIRASYDNALREWIENATVVKKERVVSEDWEKKAVELRRNGLSISEISRRLCALMQLKSSETARKKLTQLFVDLKEPVS